MDSISMQIYFAATRSKNPDVVKGARDALKKILIEYWWNAPLPPERFSEFLDAFGLSSELAASICGVERRAVQYWRVRGVPLPCWRLLLVADDVIRIRDEVMSHV